MTYKEILEKKAAAQTELYDQLSADYKKLEAADPLAHDRANIAVLTGMMGYRTEIICHRDTIEELIRAYEKIEHLQNELRDMRKQSSELVHEVIDLTNQHRTYCPHQDYGPLPELAQKARENGTLCPNYPKACDECMGDEEDE